MTWKSYLRVRTRDPAFLWRVVLAILGAGAVMAVIVNLTVDEPVHQVRWERLLDGDEIPDTLWPEDVRSARSQLREAAEARQWTRVWWLIPRASWVEVDAGPAIIALLTGLFWLLFLLQAGGALDVRQARFWMCLAALVLGAVSTWPTLFVVLWQEEVWRLKHEPDAGLAAGLRYFIAGVGLREEVLKLAFLLPLVPLLVRRRNELERLIVASSAGLGFAAAENLLYFANTASVGSVARYLMANFWHIGSTGLAGLWLCRAVRWPKDGVPQFLAYFGLVVVGHGMYDAFLVVPELATNYSMAATIILIALAYVYFHELRQVWTPRSEVVSLTANFVVGLSLLASITLVYVTSQLGLRVAGDVFFMPAVGISVLAYLFLREVPESLVRT